MELLRIENLSFTYPLGSLTALREISLSVEAGSFTAVCGATGSGKSTLLRLIKREISPRGTCTGRIVFDGKPVEQLTDWDSACRIGFVMQNPEHSLVTDKVWHELSFGLENMNIDSDTIRRRVAEMSSYFGIEDWFEQRVSALSGGQKQLLNLASVMVMQPELLILDEPTAQLDPIAAADFIATLQKLNRDLGLTILIAEHRLEEVIPICDRLLVLEQGTVLAFDQPNHVVEQVRRIPALLCAMPAAVRLFAGVSMPESADLQPAISPLTVREGRKFLSENFRNDIRKLPKQEAVGQPVLKSNIPALRFSDVFFRYERDLPDVLRGMNMTVNENEIFCILGGNGSGKSTALAAAAGLNRIYHGSISVFGKQLKSFKNQELYQNCLAMLPQDVQTLFLRNTVREELEDVGRDEAFPFDFNDLYEQHPYDLSGGEQQMLALAKVLATHPRLLLLDEPTKGLDAYTRNQMISVLKQLREAKVTVVVVTHDVEFAALCADRCALFFRGEIVSAAEPDVFFSDNNFYTTAISRMTKGFYEQVVTIEDAIQLSLLNGHRKGAVI